MWEAGNKCSVNTTGYVICIVVDELLLNERLVRDNRHKNVIKALPFEPISQNEDHEIDRNCTLTGSERRILIRTDGISALASQFRRSANSIDKLTRS